MSIRDRLRPSSSVISSSYSLTENAGKNDDVRVVTGIALSCEDISNEGDVHREYKLIRGVHRTVDFVRATLVHPSGHISVAAGGTARATFSSPVMSRRHARITFAEDGSVTVMDVGSMHGTYLEGVDFRDFFPERLKPRRHYTLQSGDTLLLGKSVARDDRDWKPVTIRVTFMHDVGARYATPPPNRYGMYMNSAGISELDEDVASISSSSGEEDDDSRGPDGSSLDTSPVASHVPLQLDGVPRASSPPENLAGGSRSVDDASPTPGVLDINRTMSTRNALRSMLPPLPSIPLSSIPRLPSLRELGFFKGTESSSVDASEKGTDGGPVPDPEQVVEGADTTIHVPASFAPAAPNDDAVPSTSSTRSVGIEDDSVSGSLFAWQEPSHPQNQLGLELNNFFQPQSVERLSEDRICSCDERSSCHCSEVVDETSGSGKEVKEAEEGQRDDEKSMEISPSSSRGGSPSFRASAVFEVEGSADTDRQDRYDEGFEGQEVCHCPDPEVQPEGIKQEKELENVQGREQREVEEPFVTPVTPGSEPPLERAPAYSTDQDAERQHPRAEQSGLAAAAEEQERRRRARAERFGLSYDPVPPSPVSISRRGKRVGSRFGPVRRSSPISSRPVVQAGWSYSGGSTVARKALDMDLLRARVRTLENRMQDISAGTVLTNSATVSSSIPAASAASIVEARKEMESIHEGLMETLVAKMGARADDAGRVERGIQAEEPQAGKESLSIHDASETPLLASRKRKRVDDLCTLGASELEAERLILSLNSQVRRPLVESIRELHEPIHQPEVLDEVSDSPNVVIRFDIIVFALTASAFVGAIIGVKFIADQISSTISSTKESLKSRGLTISDKGVSVRTTSRYSLEDYVDATQRGFIKAMNAGSFSTADKVEGQSNSSQDLSQKQGRSDSMPLPSPPPPPPLVRHDSGASLVSTGSGSERSSAEKKKRRFGLRKRNSERE